MHRKNKKKYLNILLIPDNDTPSSSFKIRYTVVYSLLTLFLVIGAGVIFGLFSYSRVLQSALEKSKVEQENDQLREQLKKVNELQTELELLRSYNERVRNSLQGYVSVTNGTSEDDAVISEAYFPEDIQKRSIFTSIPQMVPMTGFVSQEFQWPVHAGIDIVAPEGTPVKASADGIVVFSGWTYEAGYIIILYHSGGYSTLYKHSSRNLVSNYQIVHQGEVIAFSGNSGETSSGPHLHFEIWKDGYPVNPRQLLIGLNVGE